MQVRCCMTQKSIQTLRGLNLEAGVLDDLHMKLQHKYECTHI